MNNTRNVVFLYSGQGSQYYRMGEPFYQQNAEFRACLEEINSEFIRLTGLSALEELYNQQRRIGEPLSKTLYAHVSIFMLELAFTRVLIEHGVVPDGVVGSSLGDFAAAVAVAVWSWKEALEAVVVQAQLLEKHCAKGGMLAVFANHALFHFKPELYRHCELAAINNDNHFIVSGRRDNIQRVRIFLESEGVTSFALPIEYGFHSSEMDAVCGSYTEFLKNFSFSPPRTPWISCLHGKRMGSLTHDFFWQVIRNPIEIAGTIKELLRLYPGSLFIDLSPSGTFLSLMKPYMNEQNKLETVPLLTPFHRDTGQLDALLSKLTT